MAYIGPIFFFFFFARHARWRSIDLVKVYKTLFEKAGMGKKRWHKLFRIRVWLCRHYQLLTCIRPAYRLLMTDWRYISWVISPVKNQNISPCYRPCCLEHPGPAYCPGHWSPWDSLYHNHGNLFWSGRRGPSLQTHWWQSRLNFYCAFAQIPSRIALLMTWNKIKFYKVFNNCSTL